MNGQGPAMVRSRSHSSEGRHSSAAFERSNSAESNGQPGTDATSRDNAAREKASRVSVSVACIPCVKAKTRCAPERPCPRCVRLDRAHLCKDRSVHRRSKGSTKAKQNSTRTDRSPSQSPARSGSDATHSPGTTPGSSPRHGAMHDPAMAMQQPSYDALGGVSAFEDPSITPPRHYDPRKPRIQLDERRAHVLASRYEKGVPSCEVANFLLQALEDEVTNPDTADAWPDQAVDVVLGWAWNVANGNGAFSSGVPTRALASGTFLSDARGTSFTVSHYELSVIEPKSEESLRAKQHVAAFHERYRDRVAPDGHLQHTLATAFSGAMCSPPVDGGLAGETAPTWTFEETTPRLGLDLPLPMYHQSLIRLDNSTNPVQFFWKLEVNDAWVSVLGYSPQTMADQLSSETTWFHWFAREDRVRVARFMVTVFRRRPGLKNHDTESFSLPLRLRTASGATVYGLFSVKLLYVEFHGVVFAHSVASCFCPLDVPRPPPQKLSPRMGPGSSPQAAVPTPAGGAPPSMWNQPHQQPAYGLPAAAPKPPPPPPHHLAGHQQSIVPDGDALEYMAHPSRQTVGGTGIPMHRAEVAMTAAGNPLGGGAQQQQQTQHGAFQHASQQPYAASTFESQFGQHHHHHQQQQLHQPPDGVGPPESFLANSTPISSRESSALRDLSANASSSSFGIVDQLQHPAPPQQPQQQQLKQEQPQRWTGTPVLDDLPSISPDMDLLL